MLETAEEMLRLSLHEVQYTFLSQEHLADVSSYKLFNRIPKERISQMPFYTIFDIPSESLFDLKPARLVHCSFLQAIALSIYCLAIGIFWLIRDTFILFAALPGYLAGYPIDKECNDVALALDHLVLGLIAGFIPFFQNLIITRVSESVDSERIRSVSKRKVCKSLLGVEFSSTYAS